MTEAEARNTPPTRQEAECDVLRSAGAIGDFMGCGRRRAFYMLERRQIPAFKIGNIWHARKSRLKAFMARQEQAASMEAESE